MALTITEALAELKTIDKRIAKKREFVMNYLLRIDMVRDPLEKDGGSVAALQREQQAIRDLEERRVLIRRRINEANLATSITVSAQTRAIADWLIWRRDVAPGVKAGLDGLAARINQARQEATKRGAALTPAGEAKKPEDIVVNVSEQDLAKQREALEELLGVLDGQLSLKNATITIEV